MISWVYEIYYSDEEARRATYYFTCLACKPIEDDRHDYRHIAMTRTFALKALARTSLGQVSANGNTSWEISTEVCV